MPPLISNHQKPNHQIYFKLKRNYIERMTLHRDIQTYKEASKRLSFQINKKLQKEIRNHQFLTINSRLPKAHQHKYVRVVVKQGKNRVKLRKIS